LLGAIIPNFAVPTLVLEAQTMLDRAIPVLIAVELASSVPATIAFKAK
jgi:hypothetical protein